MANPVVRSSLTLETNPNGSVAVPASNVNFASSQTVATVVQEGYVYTVAGGLASLPNPFTNYTTLPGPTPNGIYEITVVNLSDQNVHIRYQNVEITGGAKRLSMILPPVNTTTGAVLGLVHLRLNGASPSLADSNVLSSVLLPAVASVNAGAQVYYRIAVVAP